MAFAAYSKKQYDKNLCFGYKKLRNFLKRKHDLLEIFIKYDDVNKIQFIDFLNCDRIVVQNQMIMFLSAKCNVSQHEVLTTLVYE